MELRHLRYFLEITKDLNMTKAAERLNMSQPPLSRQLKQLEEELGADLFHRNAKTLQLTRAGKVLKDKASALLRNVEDIEKAMKRIGKKGDSWLNIGFVPSTIYGFLPDFLRHYRKSQPQVEISLLELMSQDQMIALKSGAIDVGIGRMMLEDPLIKHEILFAEPIMLVVPKGHPLAKKNSVELAELQSEAMILYPVKPRPNYSDQISALFHKRNLEINIIQEAQELQTTLGLVASGVGVSIVPESVMKMRTEDVVYIPFKDKTLSSPVVMSYMDRAPSPELNQFIKRLRMLATINKGKRKKKTTTC